MGKSLVVKDSGHRQGEFYLKHASVHSTANAALRTGNPARLVGIARAQLQMGRPSMSGVY